MFINEKMSKIENKIEQRQEKMSPEKTCKKLLKHCNYDDYVSCREDTFFDRRGLLVILGLKNFK